MTKQPKHTPIATFTSRIGYDKAVQRGDVVLVPIDLTLTGYVTLTDAEALQDVVLAATTRSEDLLDLKEGTP